MFYLFLNNKLNVKKITEILLIIDKMFKIVIKFKRNNQILLLKPGKI